MLVIQILILSFLLFVISKTMAKFREGKISLVWFIFWLAFWAGVGVVVVMPETTSRLADLVGITRGADLVVYIAIIVLFYLVFRILVKIESIEQEITKVVRAEALRELPKKE